MIINVLFDIAAGNKQSEKVKNIHNKQVIDILNGNDSITKNMNYEYIEVTNNATNAFRLAFDLPCTYRLLVPPTSGIQIERAAEMGRELRGARDVDVGVPGFLGVDQGARPNNVGCCRPCGSAMGGSGVLGCLTSPQPQSLALAACGGKIVCSGCSAW